ncbi:hypothetical protein [Bradyrhizobium sp. 137]|uniref:hypothetical protein n=1 Tax=Bradyrhizobium sp. 137 TaxID=2782614 RepID=UPI0031FDC7E3
MPAWAVTRTAMLAAVVWFLKRRKTSNRKTIYDFPNGGNPPRACDAVWDGNYFDRLLSKHVRFAPSANAIDETRKDFDRVGWGGTEPAVHAPTPGHTSPNSGGSEATIPTLAGPTRSRSHAFRCRTPLHVRAGGERPGRSRDRRNLRRQVKLPHSGDSGAALNIFRCNGAQHCEVAGMRDTLDEVAAKLPRWGLASGRSGPGR